MEEISMMKEEEISMMKEIKINLVSYLGNNSIILNHTNFNQQTKMFI